MQYNKALLLTICQEIFNEIPKDSEFIDLKIQDSDSFCYPILANYFISIRGNQIVFDVKIFSNVISVNGNFFTCVNKYTGEGSELKMKEKFTHLMLDTPNVSFVKTETTKEVQSILADNIAAVNTDLQKRTAERVAELSEKAKLGPLTTQEYDELNAIGQMTIIQNQTDMNTAGQNQNVISLPADLIAEANRLKNLSK